jgi:hypothetical protein
MNTFKSSLSILKYNLYLKLNQQKDHDHRIDDWIYFLEEEEEGGCCVDE